MKNIKAVMAAMLLAGVAGTTSDVYAVNDGHLDGIWFNTRIKTTVKKNHSLPLSGAPPLTLNGSAVKFDSGNGRCFSSLVWEGADSGIYFLVNTCQGTGGWEFDSAVQLAELTDGGVGAAYIGTSFFVPAAGQSLVSPASEAGIYTGTIVLRTSFTGSGAVKKVTLVQPKDGTIIYLNGSTTIAGTAPSGLSMKQVDVSKVPAGAQACLASVLGGPSVPNC